MIGCQNLGDDIGFHERAKDFENKATLPCELEVLGASPFEPPVALWRRTFDHSDGSANQRPNGGTL